MNVLLWLAYKGTSYAGFQVQRNALSICEVLQNAIQSVLGVRPDVKGCSRTDAGVHARRFAVNFRYSGAPEPNRLVLALNAHLPSDVRVLEAQEVPAVFHARYAALAKTYGYYLRCTPVDDPFTVGTYTRVGAALDVPAMRRAAQSIVGTHDFSAFCTARCAAASRGDTVRTVQSCDVRAWGEKNENVVIAVTANGYLYNMVRILAGTLVQVGRGKTDPGAVRSILAGKDRAAAGPTLPARGLFLEQVYYNPADLQL